jgi:hypothetical protein
MILVRHPNAHPAAHIAICAAGCNTGDRPKDKQDGGEKKIQFLRSAASRSRCGVL